MEPNYNWIFLEPNIVRSSSIEKKKKNISNPLPWKTNLERTARGLVLWNSNSKSSMKGDFKKTS